MQQQQNMMAMTLMGLMGWNGTVANGSIKHIGKQQRNDGNGENYVQRNEEQQSQDD